MYLHYHNYHKLSTDITNGGLKIHHQWLKSASLTALKYITNYKYKSKHLNAILPKTYGSFTLQIKDQDRRKIVWNK